MLLYVFLLPQGSHTSHMKTFKGVLRVIKGPTAHFQGYFSKTVVTLLLKTSFLATSHIYFKIVLVQAAFTCSKQVPIFSFPKTSW